MLLSKVATLFESSGQGSNPQYNPSTSVPIPANRNANLPSEIARAKNRKVFRCVFHPSSKYREFLTGMMPDVRSGSAPGSFRITEGILFRASKYAKQRDCASLLIIDEINRGPAVQIFGGAIVAIEPEKRLKDDGTPDEHTQYFDLLNPADGEIVEYAFPSRLFLLAAMNQADVSVEPLDVAFLRRWAPITLEPSTDALRSHFGLGTPTGGTIPATPTTSEEVLEVAVMALEAINTRIAQGRGSEFQIGHGILMVKGGALNNLNEALEHLAVAWRQIKSHIDEAFFGDVRGAAIVLNANSGIAGNPYILEETFFGDRPSPQIQGPASIDATTIYNLLKAMCTPSP